MTDPRVEQGLSGPAGLQCLCPQTLSQKHCSTLAMSCCHCSRPWVFPGAITGLGEVLSKRYCLFRNREEGTGYALKCGNAAVFRNKFLCFRGCGKEHLWCEQNCSSSRGLRSVSCLPPAAPGTSTGCSLGPGIWVRTSNVLLLVKKPLIAWEQLFLVVTPQARALPWNCGVWLSWWPWPQAQHCGRALTPGASLGRWEAAGLPAPHGTAGSAVPLDMCWGHGMASIAHLSFVFPNISLALAVCCLPAEPLLWNSACAWAFFSK